MFKYYMSTSVSKRDNDAGSKAVEDCQNILKDMGFKRIIVGKQIQNRYMNVLYMLLYSLRLLRVKDMVVLPYPLYLNKYYLKVINFYKKIKHFKLVLFIHDINSIRYTQAEDRNAYALDKYAVRISDVIISHNKKMQDYIKTELGSSAEKYICLDIFDYLIPGFTQSDVKKSDKNEPIIIAGNLNKYKAAYLNDLPSDSLFNLYGVGYNAEDKAENIKYFGVFTPDEVPRVIEGSFGLIWDGISAEKCDGAIGRYLRYNNPHKISLYLAAGIPVIIWEEAAMADFVVNNNCGITVASLNDIAKKLSKISAEEYDNMKKNAIRLGNELRNGRYIKKAVNSAIEYLQ